MEQLKFIPEKMIRDFNEEVYAKISNITGLKFKSQIKNSGIVFQKIYSMNDLNSENKSYLILTNSESIWFKDKDDFIQKFIVYIKNNIEQLNSDYKEILNREQNAIVDENLIYFEKERIGYLGDKQLKLLNKIRSFRVVLPDVNSK